MKALLLILVASFVSLCASAQCNTTLNQLLPEKAVNNDDRFGSHIASNEQYLVVAAENSDTLGILYGGAAFVFEKTVAGWAYRAMLIPSDPDEYGFFGTDVAIDDDGSTIVVLDRLYPHNRIYIFEKPAAGWETMTESHKLVSPDYADVNASVDVSDDGNRIVVGHPWSKIANFAVFHKPATGWPTVGEPQVITGPNHEFNSTLFATNTLMLGDYLYVSATNDPIGTGIYVYKLNGSSYEYLAKLSLSTPDNSTHYFGYYLTATDDMVATTGAVYYEGAGRGVKVFVFRKNGEWEDAVETAQFEIEDDGLNQRMYFPVEFLSSTELAASMLLEDGDWYTGKIVTVKAADETWSDVSGEVIFESDQLTSRSDFTLNLSWNGSELLQSVAIMPAGLATRDAVVSLSRSGGLWGGLQQITVPRNNSANFAFGHSVHKTGNTLFAGSPYDGAAGKGAGAVYVYERSGDTYEKIHRILPPTRKPYPNGTLDTGFGYSITSFNDVLAISAPSYRYSDESLGKIFFYRRKGSSWASAELFDSISPPADLRMNHVGAMITMNERFLFASGYNRYLGSQSNGIAIFENVNGKWTYKDMVSPGRPLDKSGPSIRMSLHGNKLLVGAYNSFSGGTFIYEQDANSDQWIATSTISAYVLSSFGSDVKLMENHFFVGVPIYPYKGVNNSGAVFVYAKLPGQTWTSNMEPVAVIGAETPVEGGYFGSSLDAIGNTLVVGAPGSFLNDDQEVRTIPGNTYIIQSEDFFWANTTEYLNLQGRRYSYEERDYFGFDVGLDEEDFYIGSRNENTSAGAFSGAVYYIPTPPVIYLIPPICKGADVVQLQGYPFDGTWSGPGVEDPSGRFNPDLSGEGVFFLTYETENCAFKGTVEVQVAAGPAVSRISPEDVKICSEGWTQLELTDVPNAEYNWYFKASGTDNPAFIGRLGPRAQVQNPGEYFAAISNGACTANSPAFRVSFESVEVVIGPQPVVCNHNEIVPLKISVDNGTWEGTGILDNKFNAGTLANGKYALVYRFTTPLGCQVAVKDTIEKRTVNHITLQRVPGDFCETGTATLQATPSDPSLSFTWFYRSKITDETEAIDRPPGDMATFYEQGYYHLSATNGSCTRDSEPLQVGFNDDLEYELLPKQEEPVVLCAGDVYHLEVNTRPETTLDWFYGESVEDDFDLIAEDATPTFAAVETGYYKVTGTYGFCYFESPSVYVSFKPDTLWAPNVFTPNGDHANELFSIHTSADDLQLRIFNRYGKQIYSTPDGAWDGGNFPSGTYYWHVSYIGCRGTSADARGWVQLMR